MSLLDARLRNLRREEAQYLSIMKRTSTVKDRLAVSEKLSEVRGQIEEQQAEFQALSGQVGTVAINVSLHTDAEAQASGLHWRPLYQLKLAMRGGLNSFGNYAAAMAGFIFLLPTSSRLPADYFRVSSVLRGKEFSASFPTPLRSSHRTGKPPVC